MKNVFVEGLQGAGKSTLVSRLAAALPALRVYREGDYSPVDLAWCAWMTREEYEAALRRYEPIRDEIIAKTVQEKDRFVVPYTKVATDIPGFYADLEQHEVYNGRKAWSELREIILERCKRFAEQGCLFECAFFQNIVEDLILFHQAADDEIVAFYRERWESVDQDNFLLLYLHSGDVAANIRTIRQERCDAAGNEVWYRMMMAYLKESPYGKAHGCSSFEDLNTHLCHRQALEMRILREVVGDKAVVLPSKEWRLEEALLARIGVE